MNSGTHSPTCAERSSVDGPVGDDAIGADVGHQTGVTRRALLGDHDGILHARMRAQGGLDLRRLHPVAADLDLLVDASDELEITAGQPASEIAGVVHPAPGPKRIVGEPLGGELGLADVARGDSGTGDEQGAGHPHGYRLALGVEHVDGATGKRPADRDGARTVLAAGVTELVRDRADRRLGRAVVVEDPQPRSKRLHPLDGVPRGPLAADHQPAARQHGGIAAAEQRADVRRRDLEHVDGRGLERLSPARRRRPPPAG